ncbi:MAG: hypothetical protein A4E19_08190 [Nitrospira sp. SG-bin1]|nr:MAG: hypothetical protein A4E19_08190 [Nitrospira sp. SG-bin1]
MPGKNIVLCSDGTGNTAIKARGTNVFKLYEAVDIQGHKHDSSLKPQVAFYDDGVGTSRLAPLKVIGGAFGFGFARNVRELYTELVHVYEPGDHIYLFGFSRGAYTVRALSGLIQHCGVLDVKNISEASVKKRVKRCWKAFRKEAFKRVSDSERHRNRADGSSEQPRRLYEAYDASIEFVGVWDTVAAIGMPHEGLRTVINWFYPMRFSELTPSRCIKRACHALSIDDDRRTFYPELWNEKEVPAGQVEQVWFAGVHSNVGGGYVKHGMSLVALDWMMAEAEISAKDGYDRLRFIKTDREYVHTHQDVHDELYDARAGLGVYYRWDPRNVATLCREHHMGLPKIHVSVFERIANCTGCYAPVNLPYQFQAMGTRGARTWPSNETLREIEHQVTGGEDTDESQGGSTSLLDGLRTTVDSGKWSYRVFAAVSIYTVVAAIVHLTGLGDPLPPFPQIAEAVAEWCAHPYLAIGGLYALLGAAVWGWSKYVDGKMESVAQDHWQRHRESLRDIFADDRAQKESESNEVTILPAAWLDRKSRGLP